MNNLSRAYQLSRFVFAVLFILAGINHFVMPALYERIMPPYLPFHRALILISGGLQILCGALLFVPRWSRLAGWACIAVLLAVFPANVYMAMNPSQFPTLPPALLYLRLPLQAALVYWVYTFTENRAVEKSKT